MSQITIPRLAIGTVDRETPAWPFIRIFLRGLSARGINAQTFLSHASFDGFQDLKRWSGSAPRHLDSWLMSPSACRMSFVRGVTGADLAIVLGKYSTDVYSVGQKDDLRQTGKNPATCQAEGCHFLKTTNDPVNGQSGKLCLDAREHDRRRSLPGQLGRLCDWLGLSKLLLLSAAYTDTNLLRHEKWEGVVLVEADPAVPPLQYMLDFEIYLGVPVLGILYPRPPENAELVGEFAIWTEGTAQLWWNRLQFQRILRQSARRPLMVDEWPILDCRGRITVAIARDPVFACYFQDSLETLERCGARIVDFSPLRDERIPDGTDVIYLGCGQPGIYATELSENHCLKASIRNHVRNGGRIYAEGAGAAYLCQLMEVQPGQFVRGVGLLPAAARRLPRFGEPMPVTLTVIRRTWLTQSGTVLRGYRNPEWWFQPEAVSAPLIAEPGFEYDVLGNERVFASVIHLDLSAHPKLLDRFFEPKLGLNMASKNSPSISHQRT